MTKIKDLYIHSFRGISKEMTVSFVNKDGMPVSTIIFGDNGCGKSSIIDAIEFNLQARIERSEVLKNPKRPSPLSYSYERLIGAGTKTTLDDNTENERGIRVTFKEDETKIEMDNKRMHNDFSVVPIALRRNDIISFNLIPKERRQVLFFSFLYNHRATASQLLEDNIRLEDDPYILAKKEEYTEIKHKRVDVVNELSSRLEISVNDIPFSSNPKLNAFFKGTYTTETKSHYTKKGKKKTILSSVSYFSAEK